MTIGIVVFNQIGGAGETSATVNLATDEAVCTDPDVSIYTLLITKQGDPNRMILKAPNDDFGVLPGDTRTYMADIELLPVRNRELRLTRLFKKISKRYDYFVVDCPPHLDVISGYTLMVCRRLLVPARMQRTYMHRFDSVTVDNV